MLLFPVKQFSSVNLGVMPVDSKAGRCAVDTSGNK